MFGFHFWRALLDGKRWARRQALEGLAVVAVTFAVIWIAGVYE